MARALECPACGSRTALQSLPDAPTFKCERCGQVLKVPSEARSAAAKPPAAQQKPAPKQPAPKPPPVPPARGGAGSPAPPPRRGTPAGAVSSAATAAAVSATVNPGDPVPSVPSVPSAPSPTRRERREGTAAAPAAPAHAAKRGAAPTSDTDTRAKVRWYWRLLAWVVAVPVGFLVTAYPAYHFKWIKKNDLLDVFVGTGTSRYTRLIVLTLGWALVTALLVQLFVEGGRWIARRRRARKATSDDGDGGGRPRRPAPQPQSPAPSAARPPAAPARR